jgi:hypothetical protein
MLDSLKLVISLLSDVSAADPVVNKEAFDAGAPGEGCTWLAV